MPSLVHSHRVVPQNITDSNFRQTTNITQRSFLDLFVKMSTVDTRPQPVPRTSESKALNKLNRKQTHVKQHLANKTEVRQRTPKTNRQPICKTSKGRISKKKRSPGRRHKSKSDRVKKFEKYELTAKKYEFVPATHLTDEDEERLLSINCMPLPANHQETNQQQSRNSESTERCINKKFSNPTFSSQWQANESKLWKSKGFWNPGNLCYRNSVLQALLHAPHFVKWLRCTHSECPLEGTGLCVACQLRLLAGHYWEGRPEGYGLDKTLADLEDCLRSTAGKLSRPKVVTGILIGHVAFRQAGFDWRAQQDAPEYYGLLVAAIQENNPA